MASLAASPAAAAYDMAAAAPAAATKADYMGPPIHAASPGPSPQKLSETVGMGGRAAENVYQLLSASASSGNPQFKYLLAAVNKAGLAQTLSDPNAAITVLAPTDAAFSKFAENAGKKPEDVVADKPEVLKAILAQHVLTEGKKLSDFAPGTSIPTLGEAGIRVSSADPVRLAVIGGPGDDVTTAERGVMAGKAHVITVSRVLLPPQSAFDEI